jgi:hypothetical protein
MAWGLSGLVAGELTKLVFLECCTPCTMEVLRLWAYEPDGLRSRVVPRMRSGLELLLGMATWGVCERGDLVREEAVSARPRVWLGSRETEEGLSIWCDAFPAACRACRSGKGAAAADTAQVSPSPQKLVQCVGHDTARRRSGGQFGAPTPRSRLFHGNSLRFGQGGRHCERKGHSHMPLASSSSLSGSAGKDCRLSDVAQEDRMAGRASDVCHGLYGVG